MAQRSLRGMLFAVDAEAYFVRLGDGFFRATDCTSGAWSVSEQHISPMVGLVTHEIERATHGDAKSVARLSVDILGVVAVGDFEMTVHVVRPGRTIALIESQVAQGGRTVAIARAWCLGEHDTSSIAGSEVDDIPGPDELPLGHQVGLDGRLRRDSRCPTKIPTPNQVASSHGCAARSTCWLVKQSAAREVDGSCRHRCGRLLKSGCSQMSISRFISTVNHAVSR